MLSLIRRGEHRDRIQKERCYLVHFESVPAMRGYFLISLVAALLLPAQEKKAKPQDLEVSQFTCRRIDEQLIAVDGKVKNTGTKTFRKVVIVFEFFAPDKKSITIQKGSPEPDTVVPGDLVEFHLQLRAPARAVHIEVGAVDASGRELRVGNAGPYPVE